MSFFFTEDAIDLITGAALREGIDEVFALEAALEAAKALAFQGAKEGMDAFIDAADDHTLALSHEQPSKPIRAFPDLREYIVDGMQKSLESQFGRGSVRRSGSTFHVTVRQ